ncbi:C1 family peptidase [Asticcacaulis benevestitus]|uniref:Peptidase C1A papain C-terminal domain-containing protein n=1 Tax=Asticcacaulis benevestitus DSM 16100 = ATCC BAA-896 TaxID=1121022 RepID=V4PW11_9CAUL|nr:C1 family peptidase [Asticcacaulis benevestitus]ESQ89770.1 hypothetical protein ABENE_13590 [Asticcacaulis benevestitus DSM 16100 = ATCC BAA-896]
MERRLFVASMAAVGAGLFSEASAQNPTPALGLNFLPADEMSRLPKTLGSKGVNPPIASVRALAPPVGNQGQQGSCVGWSVGYGLASCLLNRRNQNVVLTSPSFVYNRGMLIDSVTNHWPINCGTGMYIETALSYLQGFGILPKVAFDYDPATCSRLPKLDEDNVARGNRVISGWKVATDLAYAKTSLASGVPLILGIQVRRDFLQWAKPEGKVYRAVNSPIVGGHAMLITGYDDTKGAFEIMNSWDTWWGDAGFAWVSYETILADATVAGQLRMYTVTPS